MKVSLALGEKLDGVGGEISPAGASGQGWAWIGRQHDCMR
jgi:hypothetical protein